MKDYEIFFELFGKKMKTTITALNKDAAVAVLRDKIKIHSVSVRQNADDFITFFNQHFK